MALKDMFLLKEVSGNELNASVIGGIASDATDEIIEHYGLGQEKWTEINMEIWKALRKIVIDHTGSDPDPDLEPGAEIPDPRKPY